ncbi:40230_t:CDS:2, partial [Gigaspora margarita]
ESLVVESLMVESPIVESPMVKNSIVESLMVESLIVESSMVESSIVESSIEEILTEENESDESSTLQDTCRKQKKELDMQDDDNLQNNNYIQVSAVLNESDKRECRYCHIEKTLPKKFSIENNIDPGSVSKELQELTKIEKMQIAQVFP